MRQLPSAGKAASPARLATGPSRSARKSDSSRQSGRKGTPPARPSYPPKNRWRGRPPGALSRSVTEACSRGEMGCRRGQERFWAAPAYQGTDLAAPLLPLRAHCSTVQVLFMGLLSGGVYPHPAGDLSTRGRCPVLTGHGRRATTGRPASPPCSMPLAV